MKGPTNVHKFQIAATIVGVLVIAVVGYTLWFVNHSAKVANDAYASANKSYAAKPVKKVAAATAQTQQYLTIKEWGVKLPIPTVLKMMKYTVHDANTVVLDSDDLSKLAGSTKLCGDNPGYLGGIERQTNASPMLGATLIKKIGTYYYFHTGPHESCLPLSAKNESPIPANKYPSMTLQKQADDELLKELPTAQGLQAADTAQQYLTIKEWGVKLAFSGNLPVGALYTAPQATGSLSPGVEYVTLATKDTLHINLTCGGQPGDGGEPVTHGATNNPTHLLRAHTTAELQSASNEEPKNYTHIGNYYYVYQGTTGFGDCGFTDAALWQKFKSENTAYSSATILPQ